MGDNRGRSDDSRFWGYVPRELDHRRRLLHLLAAGPDRLLLARKLRPLRVPSARRWFIVGGDVAIETTPSARGGRASPRGGPAASCSTSSTAARSPRFVAQQAPTRPAAATSPARWSPRWCCSTTTASRRARSGCSACSTTPSGRRRRRVTNTCSSCGWPPARRSSRVRRAPSTTAPSAAPKTNLAALRDALKQVARPGTLCLSDGRLGDIGYEHRGDRRRRALSGDRRGVDPRQGHPRPLHAPRRRDPPGLEFATHVGYSTPEHRRAIEARDLTDPPALLPVDRLPAARPGRGRSARA